MPVQGNDANTTTINMGSESIQFFYTDSGDGDPVIYMHGWGCDHTLFIPLADSLKNSGRTLSIDFPGFGQSELPKSQWGVNDYAHCVNQWMNNLNLQSAIIICHSFGGRVALRMAHQFPEKIKAIILIAGAGLKRKVPFIKRFKVKSIRNLARFSEAFIPVIGKSIKDRLYEKIASRDYKNAGELRPIFVKVVNDDVSEILPDIQQPVLLLYGSEDTETPPSLGQAIADALPNATFLELPGFDHLSILSQGRHQLEHQIRRFLEGLSS